MASQNVTKNIPQNRIDKSVLDNIQSVPSNRGTSSNNPKKDEKEMKKKDNCLIY